MTFKYPTNKKLTCDHSDTIFLENVAYLLNLTELYLKKIESLESITVDLVTELGKITFYLSQTKTDDSKSNLLDISDYPNLFIGEHADKFIEIMKLVQEIWQFSDYLDSYSTLELWDSGIKVRDKEHFLKILKLLHNKLLILKLKLTT
jgi:hypothetical protein